MYDNTNVFAKIIRGEIPAKEVYRDADVVAFKDVAPAAPVHVLVIPTGSYRSFDDFLSEGSSSEVANFFKKVHEIAHTLGLSESGYRLITNHGQDASQTVPHFHVHILGGAPLGGLLADDCLVR